MELTLIIHKRFVELALLLANSDGELQKIEEEEINKHIPEEISLSENNKIIKESKENLNNNKLSYSSSIKELNELCNKAEKISVITNLFKIIAVDGVVVNEEIDLLKNISNALLIENSLFDSIKEKLLLNVSVESFSNLLVDNQLSEKDLKIELKKEFTKWNNRLNTLPPGIERDNAQTIINNITNRLIELN
tara:strand:+ start:39 stop:614 length:576 start_codon:yes stop_codon:yes gene_type:complete